MPTIALMIWPVLALAFFRMLPVPVAIVTTILGGYLLLPTGMGFDLPMLPPYSKETMPAFAALLFAAVAAGASRHPPEALPGWLPRGRIVRLLLALLVVSAIMTPLTNMDPLFRGGTRLPAMGPYDVFSMLLNTAVMLLPFLVARKFLGGPEAQKTLLLCLAVAGLLYSLLALYEIRMSPQLNRMVYGYFQHSWIQHIRGDGFRPLVFLNHGIWLAIFFSGAILAAFGYWRSESSPARWWWFAAGAWLFMTLLLSKSLGALLIVLVLLPVVLLAGVRVQLLVAAAIAAMLLAYPVLRGAGMAPIEPMLLLAERIDEDRAASFRFRLENEESLLERAQERPLFGWGGFGRGRIFDEDGRNVSITDGYWIIVIGNVGWTGYLGEVGLLAGPLLLLAWRARRHQVGVPTAVLAMVAAANLVDLIPNATLTPLTWLVVGALWGRLETLRAEADAPADAEARAGPRRAAHAHNRRAPPDRDAGGPRPTTRFTRFAPRPRGRP